MKRIILSLAFALLGAGAAGAAESPCQGQAADAGVAVHGPVLHVEDGHTLCVAQGADPAQWLRVRLADAPEPAAWGDLMEAAFAKTVDCSAPDPQGLSVCRIDGESVGARLTDPAVADAGLAWRRSPSEGRAVIAAR